MHSTEVTPPTSKFQIPEFMLLMIISFMLWCIGFVDLATNFSTRPDKAILGLYTRSAFAALVGYSGILIIWLVLLFLPRSHIWLAKRLAWIQARWWAALTVLTGFVLLGVDIFNRFKWLEFRAVSAVLLILILLLGLIIWLSNWGQMKAGQWWRHVVTGVVVLFLGLEIIAQLLAYTGNLPGTHQVNSYVPYGRVYTNTEGLGNGFNNSYGWYYPEFRLDPDGHKIMLFGDDFVQALQVLPEEHMGVQLERLINQPQNDQPVTKHPPNEVLALGQAGYGPSVYLNLEVLNFAIQAFAPDEVIIALHIGNDLRYLTETTPNIPYFIADDEGGYEVHPDIFDDWHKLAHHALVGYEPHVPVLIAYQNYLTPLLLGGLFQNQAMQSAMAAPTQAEDMPGYTATIVHENPGFDEAHNFVREADLLAVSGTSNFLFEKGGSDRADEAFAIAEYYLTTFIEQTRAQGLKTRLVTIPVFPPVFYEQFSGDQWSPEVGDYDLFLPEKRLAEYAATMEIPFLGMGQTLQNNGATVEEIQALFYQNGLGHLTQVGHEFFAEAIYGCFYESGTPVCP